MGHIPQSLHLIQARNFPSGTQILMTGMNIPDMPKIVKEFKLIAVPIDINLSTTAPNLDNLKSLLNPKVRYLYRCE
jgi:perosamine synthetase